MIDAKKEEIEVIKKIIYKYFEFCEIRVFGSRVKGKSKVYSDIDLAIVTDKKIDWLLIEEIKEEFGESDLPYRVDVIDWNNISESFRKSIEKDCEVM